MEINFARLQRRSKLLAVVLLATVGNVLVAQQTELGPKCGKTYVSEPGLGYYWESPANAKCDDDETRTATAPLTKGQSSQALKITNFGFKLPAEAVVEGIEVVVIRKADVPEAIQDQKVMLIRGNQVVGTSLHTQDRWDADWTAAYYGDAQEKWETNWRASDINSPGFGFSIEVKCVGAIARPQVDEVLVTIHYSYGGESARWYRTATQRNTCSSVGG